MASPPNPNEGWSWGKILKVAGGVTAAIGVTLAVGYMLGDRPTKKSRKRSKKNKSKQDQKSGGPDMNDPEVRQTKIAFVKIMELVYKTKKKIAETIAKQRESQMKPGDDQKNAQIRSFYTQRYMQVVKVNVDNILKQNSLTNGQWQQFLHIFSGDDKIQSLEKQIHEIDQKYKFGPDFSEVPDTLTPEKICGALDQMNVRFSEINAETMAMLDDITPRPNVMQAKQMVQEAYTAKVAEEKKKILEPLEIAERILILGVSKYEKDPDVSKSWMKLRMTINMIEKKRFAEVMQRHTEYQKAQESKNAAAAQESVNADGNADGNTDGNTDGNADGNDNDNDNGDNGDDDGDDGAKKQPEPDDAKKEEKEEEAEEAEEDNSKQAEEEEEGKDKEENIEGTVETSETTEPTSAAGESQDDQETTTTNDDDGDDDDGDDDDEDPMPALEPNDDDY